VPRRARGDEALQPIFAFVRIQKMAGTPMKFVLKNSFGVGHVDQQLFPGFSQADLPYAFEARTKKEVATQS